MNLQEHVSSILGVEGRMFARHKYADGKWSNQTWKSSRTFIERGKTHTITVEMRFDDTPRNGHETFAITGAIKAGREPEVGGCIHEEIAKYFPELASLIKWHLTSIDGPMHYVANTVYHASDRDHNGLRAGERRQLRNGRTGLPCWELALVDADGTDRKHAFEWVDSETCPTNPPVALYRPRMILGEGKKRELDFARSSAVWPDATDAELMQDSEALKAALIARLPALMAEFKAAMLSCGFDYPEESK